MAQITLEYAELLEQDVPDTCIRCGQPADLAVWQKFTRHGGLFKKWIYLPIPLCAMHRGGIPFIGSVHVSRLGGGMITLANVADGFAEDLERRRASRRPPRSRIRLPQRPADWERQYRSTLRTVVLSVVAAAALCFCAGIAFKVLMVSLPARNPPQTANALPPPATLKEFPQGLKKNGLAMHLAATGQFPANVPWAGLAFAGSVSVLPPAPVRQTLAVQPVATGFLFPGSVPWTALALSQGPWPWLPDAVVDELLTDLRSANAHHARSAADRLKGAWPNTRSAEVARGLDGLLGDNQTQTSALKALARWGDRDSVPVVINLLEQPFADRGSAMDALVALKDPRAIAPIARRVADQWGRSKALQALRTFGNPAEPALIDLLTDGDFFVRREVCQILRDIGTPASIEALGRLAADNRQPVLQADAQEALQAIRKRGG
jgi:hypothetical protein